MCKLMVKLKCKVILEKYKEECVYYVSIKTPC